MSDHSRLGLSSLTIRYRTKRSLSSRTKHALHSHAAHVTTSLWNYWKLDFQIYCQTCEACVVVTECRTRSGCVCLSPCQRASKINANMHDCIGMTPRIGSEVAVLRCTHPHNQQITSPLSFLKSVKEKSSCIYFGSCTWIWGSKATEELKDLHKGKNCCFSPSELFCSSCSSTALLSFTWMSPAQQENSKWKSET